MSCSKVAVSGTRGDRWQWEVAPTLAPGVPKLVIADKRVNATKRQPQPALVFEL